MNKIHKHIAVFLIGIFVFPIFFQPVHILHHKLAKADVYGTYHKEITDGQTHSFSHISTIIDKDRHCPVCDYTFSVNDLSSFPVYEIGVPKIDVVYDACIKAQPVRGIVSVKSPRAPPYHNFKV